MSELTVNELRTDYITLHTRNFDPYMTGRSLTSEQEHYGANFDRAIAAHDREVKAEAIREAAERIDLTMAYRYDDAEYRNAEAAAEVWLRLEADRIESEARP